MRLIDADRLKADFVGNRYGTQAIEYVIDQQPTVESEPVEFEWCHDCKEYDQNAHCCHRWTKVIRNTVNDLKTQGYEPVKYGQWIDINGDGSLWRCSVCGELQCCESNYCGDCGSKMDVEEQDEIN